MVGSHELRLTKVKELIGNKIKMDTHVAYDSVNGWKNVSERQRNNVGTMGTRYH